jgi:hypothetical protein
MEAENEAELIESKESEKKTPIFAISVDDDEDGINLESLAGDEDGINLSTFEAPQESLILKGIKELRKKKAGRQGLRSIFVEEALNNQQPDLSLMRPKKKVAAAKLRKVEGEATMRAQAQGFKPLFERPKYKLNPMDKLLR